MGIKMEKRFNRQELADFLINLSKQVQSGRLEGETRAWIIPEQVEASIHLKEEEGEVVTKIKLRWPAGEVYQPSVGEAGKALSLKDVKTRLSAPFKELQRLIMAGIIPDTKTVQDFVENSHLFAKFVKPEWQLQMEKYTAHVENLERAVSAGQIEAMQHELEVLVDDMIVCHREFKK